MANRPIVCITEPIHPDAMSRLSEVAEVIGPSSKAMDWPEIADAVIVRSVPITETDLGRAKRLRVIGKHGSGTDTIDLIAAEAIGVPVLTAAGANADSVADLAIALALNLLRSADLHDAAIRKGEPLTPAGKPAFELSELPAGILGLGAVGSAVVKRLVGGFGARVLAYDPNLAASKWPTGVARATSTEEVLSNCRLLFLHLPLKPETQNLINADSLALMPAGSFIVNCARGGIVNEPALAEALSSGQIAGAASDVFEIEPPNPTHSLFGTGRFIATPHIGASTSAGLRRTGMLIANRVIAALQDPF